MLSFEKEVFLTKAGQLLYSDPTEFSELELAESYVVGKEVRIV